MPKIDDILSANCSEKDKILTLKDKTLNIPAWGGERGLRSEYDPKLHPVMSREKYPDKFNGTNIVPVTRITLNFQRLATKRMAELVCGIPVKRIYSPKNERQAEVAQYIEKIFAKNRIDGVNINRLKMLYGSCEIFTLWYAVEQRNSQYGFDSMLKLRCTTFSPMRGDELYPYFDEYGDMIAMSIGYNRKVGSKNVYFFDTYTDKRHIKWSNANGDFAVVEDEDTTLLKIPGVYTYRETPIWEDASNNVYEMEWALSRNGNYIRDNSKPKFVVYSDDVIQYGDEKDSNHESMAVLQFPKGSSAGYVTWEQAIENLKYQIDTLRNLFFTQLQLPDWSYEKMSQLALSGESRKQLFIDAQLKVGDESGNLIEFFDREVNVVKAYLKLMLGEEYHDDIEQLPVETKITPYSINDSSENVEVLLSANGNKPLISHRESIVRLGWSDDPDKTMDAINEEGKLEDFGLTE